MGFINFSEIQYVKTIDSGQIERLGSFTTTNDTELESIRLTFYKHGTETGDEQMRLNIYGDDSLETAIFNSDWVRISDIDGLSIYWIGWLRFDFNRQHLDSDNTYYVAMETSNYTRNGDTFYVAASLDWPVAFNAQSVPTLPGTAQQIFGYR